MSKLVKVDIEEKRLDTFMMSDHAAQTNEHVEGLEVVFCDTNANTSSHPYMRKGMARLIQFKEHDFLAVERVKFKEVKLLSFDMNQRYGGGYVGKLSSVADNVDLVSHSLQSDKAVEGGWKNFKITDKSSTRRDLELFDDEITFFERVSAESFAESSLKWKTSASYHFQNEDANVSDFEDFSMFEINKKMEIIMDSRKKSTCGSMPTSFGIQWKSSNDGSTLLLRDSTPNDFPCHSSTVENENSIKDESSHRWLVGQKRLSQTDDSDMHLWPSKILKCQMQEVSQPRSSRTLKSVECGEGFHRFSSPINSLLVIDEKFITPTNRNYGQKEITIVPFVNFTSVESRRGHVGIGTHLMGEDNESFTKAASVYHSTHRSSSLLGKTLSRPPTCVASPNLRKCNCTSPSPAAKALCRNIETGTTDREKQHASTERTTRPSVEKTVKACSRWVKRLQHNHSETLSLSTRTFKKCDDSSSELQKMSHDDSRSMEDHKCDTTMTFSEHDSSSIGDTEKALQSWIRRWRCNLSQASPTGLRPVSSVAFQQSENFEGKKIASIGAMALMGRAINNYKPCRIRRKDASLVWTT